MKNFFFFIFLLSWTLGASAQNLEAEENKYLGYIYQQLEYQADDPKGDILLLWTARQVPEFIYAALRGKGEEVRKYRKQKIDELVLKYPEYLPAEELENLVVDTYKTFRDFDQPFKLEGHKAPFKVGHVVNMLETVIIDEYKKNGIVPTHGTVHKWSPSNHKKLKRRFIVFARMSKLLVALSRGVTSNFMISGKEDELKKALIAKEDNSVTLEDMFRTSYRINKGDVYLTLLTIENVLSRFWTDNKRSKRTITTKLKDITNFYYTTDKFGSWYHLFGVMLYGYAEGSLKANIIGRTESFGSHLLSRFEDEKQEDFINKKGGKIGAHIRRFVKHEGYQKFEVNPEYLKESYYMQLDENFDRRLEKAQKRAKKKAPEEKEKISLEVPEVQS